MSLRREIRLAFVLAALALVLAWPAGARGAWSCDPSGGPTCFRSLRAVDVLADGTLWAAGDFVLLRGAGGGYEPIDVAASLNVGIDMVADGEGWAGNYQIQGGDAEPVAGVPAFNSIDMLGEQEELSAGVDEGWATTQAFGSAGIWRHRNGAWEQWLPGAGFSSIDMVSATEGFAATTSGDIWHYTEAGGWQFEAHVGFFLSDIDMVANAAGEIEGWAVGETRDLAVPPPNSQQLIVHYENGQWGAQPSPGGGNISKVAMVSASEGWALANFADGTRRLLRWDGTSWTVEPLPLEETRFLGDLAVNDSGQGVAVGQSGALLSLFGGAWTAVAAPVATSSLYDVDLDSPGAALAVGTLGAVSLGAGVEPVAGPAGTVSSLSLLGPGDGFAAGGGKTGSGRDGSATIWRLNAGAWSQVENPTGQRISDVDMVSDTDGWAVGDPPIAGAPPACFRYDGASWEPFADCGGIAVAAVAADDVWTVGANGVRHWDGAAWTFVPAPGATPATTFQEIAALPGGEVVIVGTGGVIKRRTGGVWQVEAAGLTTQNLHAVAMVPGGEIWAGGNEVLLHFNGTTWEVFELPGRVIFGIALADDGTGWAVGQGGLLIRLSSGGGGGPRPDAEFTWQASQNDPLTVEFDGSASSSPNGEIVEWRWDFDNNGTNELVETPSQPGPDGDPARASYEFPQAGDSDVTLTVVDSVDATGLTTQTVTVGMPPLVVNSTGDDVDANPGNGACDTGGTIQRDGQDESECTLRAAIQEANALAGADAIGFDIPGGGVPRIAPASALPPVEASATIDGSTQPGGWVELDGVQADAPAVGLALSGSDVTVRGLSIVRFRGAAVYASGARHVIEGNRIGVDVAGGEGRNEVGVVVEFATGTRVGGADPESMNVIVGSTGVDVRSTVAGSEPVTVEGNEIRAIGSEVLTGQGVIVRAEAADVIVGGESANPGQAPGNRIHSTGIAVVASGPRTQIVGNALAPDPSASGRAAGIFVNGEGSLILGNRVTGFSSGDGSTSGYGVRVESAESDKGGVIIRSNLIGVAPDGRSADGNIIGIAVYFTQGTLVYRNVVSGNDVGIVARSTDTTEIRGNMIGTDPTGSFAIPNRTGLSITDGRIGGPSVEGPSAGGCLGDCNLISGNTEVGIELGGHIALEGNFIGTDLSGTRPLPNGVGVMVPVGAPRIGGTSESGNLVAFNRAAGISVERDALGVTISHNWIHDNGGLGIDLVNDDVTPNDGPLDDDEGPNHLINFPTIDGVVVGSGGLLVTGHVDANELFGTYTVELFANRECDPTGYGEAELPLGSTTTSLFSNGEFRVVTNVPDGLPVITAAVTGPDGSTSELSACAVVEGSQLTQAVPAGATILQVASADGFLGKVVQIGEGATAETNLVTALGSLVLSRPLRFDHAEGEPVVALEGSLFVSVDRAEVRTGARPHGHRALFAGRLAAAGEAEFACGEDVVVNVGGVFEETVAGTRFRVKQGGSVCLFSGGSRGVLSLALDLARGRIELVLGKRVSLAGLANPAELALQVGDDSGSELLLMEERPGRWTYRR